MKKLWMNYSYTIILLFIILCAALLIKINLPDSTEQYMTITVMQGDSLWEISHKYKEQHGLSEGEFVKWVKKNNGLNEDTIYSGEELVIPVVENQLERSNYQELASN